MTDRVDSVIVSLLLRCKLRERLRFIDTCFSREQVHIFVRPNQSPEFSMSDMTVLSTKTGGSCGRCLLIQYDFCQAVYCL